jgi:hypothetical protein
MTEDKIQPNLNEQPEQTKPEREAQPAQQSQATTAAQSGQRATSGRKPRFRNGKSTLSGSNEARDSTSSPGLPDQVEKATARYWTTMERHKLYISEHGEDMPEVRNWRWTHERHVCVGVAA